MHAPEDWLRFIRPLNALGARYMVSGSVAAIFYGEPRLTNDIDLILFLEESQAEQLTRLFPHPTFYCPPSEIVRIEVRRERRGHFNIIHAESGFKADVYLSGTDPLHEWAIARARTVTIEGVPVVLAPPEYVIFRKLQYFEEGGSDKHLRDIRALLSISGNIVDVSELKILMDRLKLGHLWSKVS